MSKSREDCAEVDPRVQVELETLNTCTDEINCLEVQLDEANAQYRAVLAETSQRLITLQKKFGKCVDRARPYYEAKNAAKKAQIECQKAAVQFQRAASVHAAAKETISLAEERFFSKKNELNFDAAWQEVLNHATIKVMDAEKQLAENQREHQLRAFAFSKAEECVQELENKFKSEILKSRPYFEQKDLMNKELQLYKERVENLQNAVVEVKSKYSQALRNLEVISEEIHQQRSLLRREPGVGAEISDIKTDPVHPGLTFQNGLVGNELCGGVAELKIHSGDSFCKVPLSSQSNTLVNTGLNACSHSNFQDYS